MNDNNKKTYDKLNEMDSWMDIGEQSNAIARIRDYRGDK